MGFTSTSIAGSPLLWNGGAGYTAPHRSFVYNGGSVEEAMQDNAYENYDRYIEEYYCRPDTMVEEAQYHNTNNMYGGEHVWQQPVHDSYSFFNPTYMDDYGNTYNQEQYDKLSISDICYIANNDPGYFSRQQYGYGWMGSTSYRMQQERAMQLERERQYVNQQSIIRKLTNVSRKYFGLPALEEVDNKEQLEYLRRKQYVKWQEDMATYDILKFATEVRNAEKSTDKGYLTPAIQAFNAHAMQVSILQKHRDDKYDLEEFFNGGKLESIIFEQLQYNAKRRFRQLNTWMYDPMSARRNIHYLNPNYDPSQGVMLSRGLTLVGDELQVTIPPEIQRQRYQERKDKFFKSIFANNKSNLAVP